MSDAVRLRTTTPDAVPAIVALATLFVIVMVSDVMSVVVLVLFVMSSVPFGARVNRLNRLLSALFDEVLVTVARIGD